MTELQSLIAAQWDRLAELGLKSHADAIAGLGFQPAGFSIDEGIIDFKGEYTEPDGTDLASKIARDLMPWRKGPFRLAGLDLDAEWRSDKKWDRLHDDLPALEGKIVADVGCNNGYYLYRIAAAGAGRVVGFDPTLKYWLQFQLLEKHAPELPIEFLPLGWQALRHFPAAFDVIFIMGVNYHEANPAEMFHTVKAALKPGGKLICESVTIPAQGDIEIFPAGKYAGIGGVYAVPSAGALARQLTAAGFGSVKKLHEIELTADEQRRSEFSPETSFPTEVPTPRLCRAAFSANA